MMAKGNDKQILSKEYKLMAEGNQGHKIPVLKEFQGYDDIPCQI